MKARGTKAGAEVTTSWLYSVVDSTPRLFQVCVQSLL